MINLNDIPDNKIHFTSDTHFGQERTLELSKRPFTSVEEMDRTMMVNWNTTVGKDDIVIHLGDFGNYEMAEKLNGRIYLVLGNYERKDINEAKITTDDLTNKYGFKGIGGLGSDRTVYARYNDIVFAMMHEPENYDKSCFNLFGHIHGRQMVKRFGLDVGVDCHYFKPISIKDVLFYKTAIEKYYDNNVFM